MTQYAAGAAVAAAGEEERGEQAASGQPSDPARRQLLTLKRPGIDVECLELETDSGSQTPFSPPGQGQGQGQGRRGGRRGGSGICKTIIAIQHEQACALSDCESESKDLFGTSPSPRNYLLEQAARGWLGNAQGNAGSSIISSSSSSSSSNSSSSGTVSSAAVGTKGKKQQRSTYGSLDMLNHENL